MINPNRDASEDVLRRLKEGSYERMRVELKCSVEAKMKDFDMTWEDIGCALDLNEDTARWRVMKGLLSLDALNTIAHIFSCEPYIIFRPRDPWIKT